MTKDKAKNIFDYHKINSNKFIGRKSIFVGFYYFEKSKVLFVEYISRAHRYDKEKARFVCSARYATTEFNKEELEIINEKELTLF